MQVQVDSLMAREAPVELLGKNQRNLDTASFPQVSSQQFNTISLFLCQTFATQSYFIKVAVFRSPFFKNPEFSQVAPLLLLFCRNPKLRCLNGHLCLYSSLLIAGPTTKISFLLTFRNRSTSPISSEPSLRNLQTG